MNEKTCIVTGGNSGIGKAVAKALARMNHRVVIVCRNPGKGEAALAEIIKESENESVHLVIGNLDTIAQVKNLAATLIERFPETTILINNAGVWMLNRVMTQEGLEYSFMVNHLAPFILSNLLFPTLKKNSPARIVNVNAGLYTKGNVDLKATPYGNDFGRFKTYMNTKLCNVLFTREFARRIAGSGVTINAVHPGVIRTNLGQTPGMGGVFLRLFKLAWGLPAKGARAPVWLATSPEVADMNGKFFILNKEKEYTENAKDDRLAREVWQLSADLSGIG